MEPHGLIKPLLLTLLTPTLSARVLVYAIPTRESVAALKASVDTPVNEVRIRRFYNIIIKQNTC